MNEDVEALKEHYAVVGNILNYVKELEDKLEESKSADSSQYFISSFPIKEVPQFQEECKLYIPSKYYTQNKCGKCNRYHMRKVENTDRFDKFVMCDCFDDTPKYMTNELSVFCVINNFDDRAFFYGFMNGEFVIYSSEVVYLSVDEIDINIPYDKIAFTSKEECEKYCDLKNRRN